MMNQSIFKAYDIRGLYPSEVNEEVASKIGRGLGRFFVRKGKPKIIVARDGRIGSLELYRALIKGIRNQESGIRVIRLGIATTPMFYVLVQLLEASGGIMVTASHNPKEYNGFKVVGHDAEMINGKEVLRIMNKEL